MECLASSQQKGATNASTPTQTDGELLPCSFFYNEQLISMYLFTFTITYTALLILLSMYFTTQNLKCLSLHYFIFHNPLSIYLLYKHIMLSISYS